MKRMYFVALTTYQIYVSDTYASYICKLHKDIDVKIIVVGGEGIKLDNSEYEIINVPNLNNNKVNRFVQRLIWAGHFFAFTPLHRYFNKNDSYNLFIFNDNEPITNKLMRTVKRKKSNTVTIIEEGIGMYEKTSLINGGLTLKQKLRYAVTWFLGSPMQYKAVGENKLIDNVIVGDVELFKTLDKSKGKNIIEQNKAGLLAEGQKFLSKIGIDLKNVNYCADVMYLGQPLSESGNLLKEEIEYIEQLAAEIDRFLIKPHPRDMLGKYDELARRNSNIAVIDNNLCKVPLECLIGVLGITKLVTLVSSAGVNISKTNPSVNSIFTYNIKEAKKILQYVDNGYVSMNKALFNSNYNNIYVPKTIEEYIDIVKVERKVNTDIEIDATREYKEMDYFFV